MHDEYPFRWCLLDAGCMAFASAAVSGLVSVARRLLAIDQLPRSQRGVMRAVRRCVGGFIVGGAASGALCLLGGEIWPTRLASVAATTVLMGVALDYSSERASGLLRAMLVMMARTYLREMSQAIPVEEEAPRSQPQRSFPDDAPGDGRSQ